MQKRKMASNKSRLIGQNVSRFEAIKSFVSDLRIIISETEKVEGAKWESDLELGLILNSLENAQEIVHKSLNRLSTLELNKTLSQLKGKLS